MSGPFDASRPTAPRVPVRQLIVGLLALPLSALPFFAYANLTPEGRLVRDKAIVALSPPTLPVLTPAAKRAAAAAAPDYHSRVMALVYHGIGSTSDAEGGFVTSPKRFGEHLATLKAAGMHTVTAADVARAFATGKALPDNAVMISFDDGRTDAMLFGDPLLEQAGMKATMFVISGAAERPGIYYAGWGRLRAAARSGRWDIQAHSHAAHHEQRVAGGRRLPALTSLAPGESLAQYRVRVRDDLERNSAAIQAHVGRRPVAFAYPFGAYGAERTNDPAIRQILREEVARRYVLAFHQDDQDTIPLVDPGQDRVGLRRLEVGNWSGIRLLERIAKAAADGSRAAGDLGASTTGVSPLVVKQLPPPLPPIPFVGELRQEPAPIPRPGPRAPAPVPTQAPASPPTSATVPPPAEAPPTTTTDPPTTTTNPPTTNPPTPTTTTNPSTTTTGPPCIRGNGKPCRE